MQKYKRSDYNITFPTDDVNSLLYDPDYKKYFFFVSNLECAFPEALNGEKETSNSWSIPSIFFTKY